MLTAVILISSIVNLDPIPTSVIGGCFTLDMLNISVGYCIGIYRQGK